MNGFLITKEQKSDHIYEEISADNVISIEPLPFDSLSSEFDLSTRMEVDSPKHKLMPNYVDAFSAAEKRNGKKQIIQPAGKKRRQHKKDKKAVSTPDFRKDYGPYLPPSTKLIKPELKFGSECGLFYLDTLSRMQQKDRLLKNTGGFVTQGYIIISRIDGAELNTNYVEGSFVRFMFMEVERPSNNSNSVKVISQIDFHKVINLRSIKNCDGRLVFSVKIKSSDNIQRMKEFNKNNTCAIAVLDLFMPAVDADFFHADRFVTSAFEISSKVKF